jgi:hypothetical protein
MALDLSSIITAFKVQSVQGTAVTGASAKRLDILPSQGFQQQIQEVVSELLDTTRNAGRPRQGTRFYNWAADMELQAEIPAISEIIEAVVGGTRSVQIDTTESTLTQCTISGTGTTITFTGGSVISLGGRVGMFGQFTNLSVAANNAVPFPITAISANGRVLTVPSGYLADNVADTAFTFSLLPAIYSDDPYTKRYFTMEHYLGTTIDRSLRGTDFVFNSLGVDIQPNRKVKLSVGMGGRVLELLAAGSSPNFTSPVLTQAESLYLVDGGFYLNGVKRVDISSLSMRYEAPVSGLALATAQASPDTYLGQFKMTGQMTGSIADGTDFDAFDAETRMQLILHCKEQSTTKFVSICIPNASYGGWTVPGGGEGPAIQTVPINAGKDKRGATSGYAPTSLLFAASAF